MEEGIIMDWDMKFFLQSILLGLALAMDAFSVSLVVGLHEPRMKKGKSACVAGTFSFFQFFMPLMGWICVHAFVSAFAALSSYIPWIALLLLSVIGLKMLWEGVTDKPPDSQTTVSAAGLLALTVQGIATSIDALSVGFTVAEYDMPHALAACALIGFTTFFVCFAGLLIGKTFGTHLSGKASILGGILLILIGIEIFITS